MGCELGAHRNKEWNKHWTQGNADIKHAAPSAHSCSLSLQPRVTYQILRENVYSPSAWYVPFVVTLGSILLLGFLLCLIVLLAKAISRCCPCKTRKNEKPP